VPFCRTLAHVFAAHCYGIKPSGFVCPSDSFLANDNGPPWLACKFYVYLDTVQELSLSMGLVAFY